MKLHKYPGFKMPKAKRLRKGVRISSEPLFLLTFYREKDEQECLVELTQKQIAKLLEQDGIRLIHLMASIDGEGNWRKKEVRI